MAAEEDTRGTVAVVIHTVILVHATIFSLTGNMFIIYALYRNRRLRTITNFYVVSLALADMMMAILSFPFQATASGLRKWFFGHHFCQLTGFVVQYWVQVSLSILTLASLNRYFCVVKPNKYSLLFTHRKTVTSLLGVWIILCIELLIFVFTAPIKFRWIPDSLYCRTTFDSESSERISFVFFACFFAVLMSVVVFCYYSIYRVVKQHNNVVVPSLQRANNHGRINAQDVKSSRAIFAAVLGFSIAWCPFIFMSMLEFGFQVSIPSSAKSVYPLFSSLSAWINPVIYGIMNRAMRNEFRNILFCRKD